MNAKPVVIVTGASGGIGRACVNAFLKAGARVVMADVKPSSHPRARFIRTDISEEASVQNLIAQTMKMFGGIDVLVNNAAVLVPTKAVHNTTLAEFNALVSVNIRGTFLCCKHAYRHLKRSRGCIVNVSSMAGVLGEKNHAVYAATKGAINALTKAMAVDYGLQGVRVNAVCPGGVRTPNAEKVIRAMPDAAKIVKLRDSIHAVGYTASPEQIAGAVTFLASPAAGFMTGAIVPVSGGMECGYGIKY